MQQSPSSNKIMLVSDDLIDQLILKYAAKEIDLMDRLEIVPDISDAFI